MTDEERGRKRYCMKCEKVKPGKEFAETSKGGIERNCKLHSTGKDDTSMTEVGKLDSAKSAKTKGLSKNSRGTVPKDSNGFACVTR